MLRHLTETHPRSPGVTLSARFVPAAHGAGERNCKEKKAGKSIVSRLWDAVIWRDLRGGGRTARPAQVDGVAPRCRGRLIRVQKDLQCGDVACRQADPLMGRLV